MRKHIRSCDGMPLRKEYRSRRSHEWRLIEWSGQVICETNREEDTARSDAVFTEKASGRPICDARERQYERCRESCSPSICRSLTMNRPKERREPLAREAVHAISRSGPAVLLPLVGAASDWRATEPDTTKDRLYSGSLVVYSGYHEAITKETISEVF